MAIGDKFPDPEVGDLGDFGKKTAGPGLAPDAFGGPGEATDPVPEYRFSKKVVQHLFCPDCGVQTMVRGVLPDGTKVVGINVRCFDEVDLGAIEPVPYDGKAA